MGGYLSGRRGRRPGAAPLVEATPRLDVGGFRLSGLRLDAPGDDPPTLARGKAGAGDGYGIRLDAARSTSPDDGPIGAAVAVEVYLLDADDAPAGPRVRVPLTWYRVGYGWRPVFVCRECGRRARHVYAPRWTCRRCARLAYLSTRQPDYERAERRARRAAAALGWPLAWRCDRGTLAAAPAALPRPYGMRWRTWQHRLDVWADALAAYRVALDVELLRGWPPPLLGGPALSPARRAAMLADARATFGRRLARR